MWNCEKKNTKKKKKNKIQEISNKRNKGTENILKNLQEILTKYSNDNNISIILDKRNLIIGKSDLDITKEVMIKLDQKLPSVKIN